MSTDDLDVDFDAFDDSDFDPSGSDKFRIAFAAHMIDTGDEGRAYARALADCGTPPPPAKSLKKLGEEIAQDSRVRSQMHEIRLKLTDSYVDRLEEHMDQLADLRDMAKAEGKYAPAVAAEVARGRVQGFYTPTVAEDDKEDARGLGEDELRKRVALALQRMSQKNITSGDAVADFATSEADKDY